MALRSSTKHLFACAVSLSLAFTARAGDAESLLAQGIELRKQGKDAEALKSFRAAHAIQPTPRAVAQMGLAEQALGDWLDASAHLVKALSAGDDPWIVKNREALDAARAVIDEHLGWLEVTASIEGAEIWIDGAHRATSPLASPIRVIAGTSILEVRAAGYETVRRRVEVLPGGTSREVLVLTRAGALAPPPTPPVQTPHVPKAPPARPSLVLPFVLLGAGTAITGGAVVAHVVSLNNAAVYNDDNQCFLPPMTRDQRCGDRRRAAEIALGLGIGGYVLGGLSLAAGTYFLVDRRRARPPRVACTPALLGFDCHGAF